MAFSKYFIYVFLLLNLVSLSADASEGKNDTSVLLEDLTRIPEAGAFGGIGAAKEALLDIALRRGAEALSAHDTDLLNRLELEYGLSEGGLDRYSAWSVQPLYSSPSGSHHLFVQGGYTNMDGRETGGGDLVYRYMTKDQQALYGAHLGYDHQWPYHHSRLTTGLEYQTSLFGVRASYYYGLSDWTASETGFEEAPLDGSDVELSGRVPQLPEVELFTRAFYWNPDSNALTNDGKDIWGYEVAAEYTPINAITLRTSIIDDNDKTGVSGQGMLRLNYRLGMGWDELISRPRYELASVKERRFDRMRRERTMRLQTRVVARPEVGGSSGISGPTGCPNIGDTCSDGSIYAGLSPDGNVRMYTTPADSGQFTWDDDGLFIFFTDIDTTMANCDTGLEASCRTGENNTALLITEDANGGIAGIQPHDAAHHCADLIAHGQSDWYLPARDELDVLYENLVDQDGDNIPGGPLGTTYGFNISGALPAGYYWSSSEANPGAAWYQRYNDGGQVRAHKRFNFSVRCVRRD